MSEPMIFRPTLSFLSDQDKARIHEAALAVLETVGQTLYHQEALELLKKAGCPVEDGNRVMIPRQLVEQAVRTAPDNVPIFDREGRPAMDLGGRRAYFGTGSDLIYRVESDGTNRHKTMLADIVSAARVCDALPNIDFIMSFAHPNDIAPERSYLESFVAMTSNSTKPIVNTADNPRDMAAIWEVSKAVRGGDRELREKPFWVHYDEPISPLKHPENSVGKLILCAKAGQPVIYSPAPISGSTAPITMAGHVAQGLAECFFGLVIHQLTAEGAPFIMGMGPAVLDMATGQCSYNAPEYLMAYMAIVEMHHYFNLPNWGYAGTSDAQLPDMQAAVEAGMLTYMAAAAGSNLNHDVGYLDFGRAGSLEMVVIMDETIDQIRRMHQGIEVTDETLAVDVIREAGRQGHFLTHPHSLKHLRTTQWRPRLFSRQGYEKWVAGGSTSLLDRARRRLAEIREEHTPQPLDPARAAEARRIADAFQG